MAAEAEPDFAESPEAASEWWELDDGAARWYPDLQAERLGDELEHHAEQADYWQWAERQALAQQHIAGDSDPRAAAEARDRAQQAWRERRAAEAEAYDTAAAMQEAALDEPSAPSAARPNPMPRMDGVRGPEPALAPVPATLPDATLHSDPYLASRGWQPDPRTGRSAAPQAEAV
jgi:hypothetical protein